MGKKNKNVKVTVDASAVSVQRAKKEVIKLSQSTAKLIEESITRKALVALIHDSTRVKKKVVNTVIDALIDLPEFLSPKVKVKAAKK